MQNKNSATYKGRGKEKSRKNLIVVKVIVGCEKIQVDLLDDKIIRKWD